MTSVITESTMNGMSSDTMSTTVCGEPKPCSSKSGEYTRTQGFTRRSVLGQGQVRHRGAVQVVHGPGREVAAGDVAVVLADERPEQPQLLRGQPLLGVPPDLVDDLGPVAGRDGGHGDPLRRHPACSFRSPRQGRWAADLAICAWVHAQSNYRRPPAPVERRPRAAMAPVLPQSATAATCSPSDRPFGTFDGGLRTGRSATVTPAGRARGEMVFHPETDARRLPGQRWNGLRTMADKERTVDELSESACWALLRTTTVGRLAVWVDDHPDIFPLNYAVDHGTLAFRSMQHQALSPPCPTPRWPWKPTAMTPGPRRRGAS